MENCKNCGHSIRGDQKYCPNCGQKNRDKLTFKGLMGELASTFLSWDSKFFRTIVPLITKPGKVSTEYREGKRQTFVAPLRLYLFFSVLFFFTLSMMDQFDISIGGANKPEQLAANDDTLRFDLGYEPFKIQKDSLENLVEQDRLDELPVIKNEKSKFQKMIWKRMLVVAANGGSFGAYVQKNISIMFFFFLPAFGIVLWLFFLRKKLDYIEHLIYGIYFHSFLFFMLWIVMILSRVTGNDLPLIIGILYMLIYLMIGVKRYYGTKTYTAIIKSILISVVYFVTFVFFILITLTVSVFLF